MRGNAEGLAREAGLGLATIGAPKLPKGATSVNTANDFAVRRALESASVDFIDENGGGAGSAAAKAATQMTLTHRGFIEAP